MADKSKKSNKLALTGKKIGKFFIDLRTELKKVVWPDRKRLIQSTATVLMICIFAAIFIFSVDKILSGFLNLVGFFPGSTGNTSKSTSIVYVSDSNVFTADSGDTASTASDATSTKSSTSAASSSASGK
jgi:preprotein translocase subunit SecE